MDERTDEWMCFCSGVIQLVYITNWNDSNLRSSLPFSLWRSSGKPDYSCCRTINQFSPSQWSTVFEPKIWIFPDISGYFRVFPDIEPTAFARMNNTRLAKSYGTANLVSYWYVSLKTSNLTTDIQVNLPVSIVKDSVASRVYRRLMTP